MKKSEQQEKRTIKTTRDPTVPYVRYKASTLIFYLPLNNPCKPLEMLFTLQPETKNHI